eukprot:TRINITY_DN5703_c0_g1_i10.p1 TRINITY_DN5703_c0_g1~~TRINITY_DN5703_c0_g1_i10.p1  ORF type:complete len:371 (-),score=106.07 TRINITY_DN5703_c0_g1_i10:49-1161(-)
MRESGRSRLKLINPNSENWETDLYDIWNNDPNKLPIHIDIPRLISKITIVDQNRCTLWSGNYSTPTPVLVLDFFKFLTNKLNDVSFVHLTSEEERLVLEKESYLENQLARQMKREEMKESSVVRILKALNQKVLFPAYYHIKETMGGIQIKDKANTWTVVIMLEEDKVSIQHQKTQIIPQWVLDNTSFDNSEVISFQWSLSICLVGSDLSRLDGVMCQIVSGTIHRTLIPDLSLVEYFEKIIPIMCEDVGGDDSEGGGDDGESGGDDGEGGGDDCDGCIVSGIEEKDAKLEHETDGRNAAREQVLKGGEENDAMKDEKVAMGLIGDDGVSGEDRDMDKGCIENGKNDEKREGGESDTVQSVFDYIWSVLK